MEEGAFMNKHMDTAGFCLEKEIGYFINRGVNVMAFADCHPPAVSG